MSTQFPVITVAQFGGNWVCLQVNSLNETMSIDKVHKTHAAAEIAATQFAKQKDLPYKANCLLFNKPVMTIWKAHGAWLPAKIFQDRIVGAGILEEHKQPAYNQAKQIAENEDLDFIPSIGESIFDKK